jgi:SH3-like domain-containing protein
VWVYVNLREGPGTQYKIVGKAYMKSSFAILAENPEWLRVRLENGAEGWMSKKAVALDTSMTSSPQGPPASSPPSSGSKLSSKPLSPM